MNIYPKLKLNGYLIIFLPILLMSCLKTRDDIKEVEKSRVIQEQVSTLQKENAEKNSHLDDIADDLRRVTGKVETLENSFEKSKNHNLDQSKRESEQISEMQRKLDIIQEELAKIVANITFHEESIKSLNEKVDKAARTTNIKTDVKVTSAQVFAQANELFNQKKWQDAILVYDKYRKENPKAKNIDEAIYKTGVCFQELKMVEESIPFYEEVINKYPNSKFAKKSQYKLKTLNPKTIKQ